MHWWNLFSSLHTSDCFLNLFVFWMSWLSIIGIQICAMCKERLDVVNVSCVSGFEVKVCSFVNTTAVVKTDLTINCVCVVWVGRGLEQIYTMLKHMVLFTSLNSCCLVAQSDLRGQTSKGLLLLLRLIWAAGMIVKKLRKKREYLLSENTHKQIICNYTKTPDKKKLTRKKTKYRGEHHRSRQHLRPDYNYGIFHNYGRFQGHLIRTGSTEHGKLKVLPPETTSKACSLRAKCSVG